MENRDNQNYKQLNDEILIGLAQQGEPPVFDVLPGRYRSYISKYLLRLIIDPDAAEVIIQDVFLKAYNPIHQYRGDASFKSWLFVIVRNTWIEHLRSHHYQARIDHFQGIYKLDHACEQHFEKVIIQQESSLLQAAIKNLPSKQSRTVLLRINQQLSFGEIADVMQCSLRTVKVSHYYGVKTVEQMIAA